MIVCDEVLCAQINYTIYNAVSGIEAKILFFSEKIEAESPTFSFSRKGNTKRIKN